MFRLIAMSCLVTLAPAQVFGQSESPANELAELETKVQALSNGGQGSAALEAGEKLLKLQRQQLETKDPKIITTLELLAGIYEEAEDWPAAESKREEALAQREAALGAGDWRTIDARLALEDVRLRSQLSPADLLRLRKAAVGYEQAFQLYSSGRLRECANAIEAVVKTRREVLGEYRSEYALCINNLADVQRAVGNYQRSEELNLDALRIRKKILGRNHPEFAQTLNNMASLYTQRGEYAQAMPLLREASEIWKNVFSEQHPNYGTTLGNLGGLYRAMGDIDRAERCVREVLALRKVDPGMDSAEYATSLCNLAGILSDRKNFAEAEKMYLDAIKIDENAYGPDHIEVAEDLYQLAGVYRKLSRVDKSMSLYARAQAIRRKRLGEEHPSYAQGLNNLGWLHHELGDFEKAGQHFQQASDVFKVNFGDRHPDYATSLNNLAFVSFCEGDLDAAKGMYHQALMISLANQDSTSVVQSEAQQLAQRQREQFFLDTYLNCLIRRGDLGDAALDAVLGWKGAVMMRQRGARVAADSTELRALFAELQSVAREWSAMSRSPRPEGAAWDNKLASLTERKERLEADLMAKSSDFRRAMGKTTYAQLQAAIPPNGVLIDFVEYVSYSPAPVGGGSILAEPSLLALVVRRDQDVQMFPLGETRSIAKAIDQWRIDFGSSPESVDAGKVLRERLWQPLERAIEDASLVLISPDGALGRLPFGALPGKLSGTYLLEQVALVNVPVPQLLPFLENGPAENASSLELLVAGGIDYDSRDATLSVSKLQAINDAPKSIDNSVELRPVVSERHWRFLPGTDEEMKSIRDMYCAAREVSASSERIAILGGRDATEEAFRRLAPQAQVLHLATHGFFADPDKKSATQLGDDFLAIRGLTVEDQALSPRGYSPGLLSGLVFAGANDPPRVSDNASNMAVVDDGYLTADEIASLPLGGAKLVVLSACESGLGETAGGEGLLGMQRAFQIAGARSTVATLWKVNDGATKLIMQEFYKNYLQRKMPPAAAIREAQLWALNNEIQVSAALRGEEEPIDPAILESADSPRLPPKYWAAFVASGSFD